MTSEKEPWETFAERQVEVDITRPDGTRYRPKIKDYFGIGRRNFEMILLMAKSDEELKRFIERKIPESPVDAMTNYGEIVTKLQQVLAEDAPTNDQKVNQARGIISALQLGLLHYQDRDETIYALIALHQNDLARIRSCLEELEKLGNSFYLARKNASEYLDKLEALGRIEMCITKLAKEARYANLSKDLSECLEPSKKKEEPKIEWKPPEAWDDWVDFMIEDLSDSAEKGDAALMQLPEGRDLPAVEAPPAVPLLRSAEDEAAKPLLLPAPKDIPKEIPKERRKRKISKKELTDLGEGLKQALSRPPELGFAYRTKKP